MVRSKADVTTAELGDEYVMMGPYNESTVRLEVEVGEPDNPIIQEVVGQMRSHNVKVRTQDQEVCGEWEQEGWGGRGQEGWSRRGRAGKCGRGWFLFRGHSRKHANLWSVIVLWQSVLW